jgi:hypothetical protein
MSQIEKNKAVVKRYFEAYNNIDALNYVVEAIVASEAYPDLVGAYWKGSLTTKTITLTLQKPINQLAIKA